MPKFVNVFGRKIPVKYCTREQIDEIYKGAAGVWDANTRTIYLSTDFTKEEQQYTLFHEMGHAVMNFTGLDLVLPPEVQELVVQSFSTLIEDVLNQTGKFEYVR